MIRRLLWMCLILTLIVSSSEAALSTKKRMPEFLDIPHWINTPHLQRQDLFGKVVLVQFWSSSTVESLRDVQILKKWYAKYQVEGFEIIGIHSPEFDFQKNLGHVQASVDRYEIPYPIALDNEMAMWYAYNNFTRPTHYLIDAKGRIRYVYQDETDYLRQEYLIQDLLKETGVSLDLELEETDIEVLLAKIRTPSIYLGYRQLSHFGNEEDLKAEIAQNFKFPSIIYPDLFYLYGQWQIMEEKLRLLKPDGALLIRYDASSVYMIIGNPNKKPIRASLKLDNRPLDMESKGKDVLLQEEKSYLQIGDYRLYHLVDTQESYGEHLLQLTFEQEGVELFLLTFGGPSPLEESSEELEEDEEET